METNAGFDRTSPGDRPSLSKSSHDSGRGGLACSPLDHQVSSQPHQRAAFANALIYTLVHIYGLAYISDMNLEPTTLCACLADSTRLRVLALLDSEGELCVCELVYALADIQPKISRHLALLRRDGVILDRRDGTRIFYRLAPGLPEWGRKVIRLATSAATKQKSYRDDRRRLVSMPNRPERSRAA